MKCRDFKKWVSDDVDGELAGSQKAELDGHMAHCESCRKAYEAMALAWDILGELPKIEPSPAFVSRFWTKVATQGSRQKGFGLDLRKLFVVQRLIPAALVLSLFLIIGSVSVWKNDPMGAEMNLLGSLDLEFVENIELAEHLDVIRDMDWLQDMDIIQELDNIHV